MQKTHLHTILLSAALFGAALLSRAFFLDADPPANLSWSLAPFTDDPAAMTPARLAVQEWKGQSFKSHHPDSNPFLTQLITGVMFLLGPGLWQGRLLFVLAGCACCVMLFLLIRRPAGDWPAALAGLFLSTNYIFMQYNRLALEETLVIFFGMAALVAAKLEETSLKRAFLAGVFLAAAAVLVKLHGWLFVALLASVAAVTLRNSPGEKFCEKFWKRYLQWCVAASAGFLLVWATASFFAFKPAYAPLAQYFVPSDLILQPASVKFQSMLLDLPGRFLTLGLGTHLLNRMPLVSLLGLAMVIVFLSQPNRQIVAASPALLLMVTWLLFGMFSLGLLRYRPLRYELLLIPPLCALAALALGRLAGRIPGEMSGQSKVRTRLISFFGFAFILYHFLYHLFSWLVASSVSVFGFDISDFPDPLIWPQWLPMLLVAALLASALLVALLATFKQAVAGLAMLSAGRCLRMSVSGLLAAGILAGDLWQEIQYLHSRQYNTLAASRDLNEILSPEAVVAGIFADAVTMETTMRSCPYSGRPSHIDFVLEACPQASHLIVRDEDSSLHSIVQDGLQNGTLTLVQVYYLGPLRPEEIAPSTGSVPARHSLYRIHREFSCPPTEFERGAILLVSGDETSAEDAFRKFLSTHPAHAGTLLQLASLARGSSGQPSAASEELLIQMKTLGLTKFPSRRLNAADYHLYTRLLFGGK